MGRSRRSKAAPDTGPQMTTELSTEATRITSKGVSTSDPAPTSAENPNADKGGTNGG